MGTFGPEFWNVTALESGQLSPRPIPEDNAGTELQRICVEANRQNSGRGAIIYLPPRNYVIRAGTSRTDPLERAFNTPDLHVYSNLTLWFAPGARLVIRPNAMVRIDGPVCAEPTQIFECEGQDSLGPPAQRRGRVLLGTTRVTEVYPEWWGAIASPDDGIYSRPFDDTEAFEDCIRTAHTLRVIPGPAQMPSIPIVLRGKYTLRKEIEVSAQGPRLIEPRTLRDLGLDRTLAFAENTAGLVLLGRRAVSGANAGFPALVAGGDFSPPADPRVPRPTDVPTDVTTMPSGRALLRLVGLHGSVIEGVGFDGARRASVCMQVTGHNARSNIFRGCSFVKAWHVLAQVGDYVIVDGTATTSTGTFPRILPGLDPGLDLSGLVFEDCRFESDISIPDAIRLNDRIPLDPPAMGTRPATPGDVTTNTQMRNDRIGLAHQVSGIVFQAGNTLPMTLDRCFFIGGMKACVEAYGGTLIVRGGGAQNQATPTPYLPNIPVMLPMMMSPFRFERPRGGVDFFLGDPLIQGDNQAASPTGLTILQFESQSDQLLDTFRHVGAGAGRVPYYPSVLQAASHKFTQLRLRAPPAIVWAGPGIQAGVGKPASLTLVGCLIQGPRAGTPDAAPPMGPEEPSGVVLVDARAFLVNDVGTRTTSPSVGSAFFTNDFSMAVNFIEAPIGRFLWLRSM